jgi:hypothetical protein
LKPTIYTASKPRHAPMWRKLRMEGYNIIATWIDYADGSAIADWQKLWLDCTKEAAAANITLLYVEKDDEIRGAYVEMGIAIANHRRVMFVNPDRVHVSDAINHPLVTQYDNLYDALAVIRKLSDQAEAWRVKDKRAA